MKRVVVDTDVVSYLLKNHPFASAYAGLLRDRELIISFMTVTEMRLGAVKANWGVRRRDRLEEFLGDFGVCYPDDQMCTVCAEMIVSAMRKGRPLSPADAWIAATALYLNVPLVTNNVKHFRHLDQLTILSAA